METEKHPETKYTGICTEIDMLLLRKGCDYGPAAATPPILRPDLSPSTAIFVRMSDKIARLRTLALGKSPSVTDETLRDTLLDLAGYCVLAIGQLDATHKE